MNPRRPSSNRPPGRRGFSGNTPGTPPGTPPGNQSGGGFSGGGSGGRSGGGFGGRSGGGRFGGGRSGGGGKPDDLPVLLGEPSPSLAKINTMNMVKLREKIASLKEEQTRMAAKLAKLEARDPAPADQVEAAKLTLVRLKALEDAAAKRLAGKIERKGMREQRNR